MTGWLIAAALLGGVLAESPELATRWAIAGRWQFPVGDPRDFCSSSPDAPAYSMTRNVGGPSRHLGADLSNRRSGGPVRAAAHGVVLLARDTDVGNGYGLHVVLAHRLEDGTMVYSVYAHLSRGTIAVRAGNRVSLGDLLGRVGATGVATAPHLHFEVRVPRRSGDRWETGEAVDPIAFVRARLPDHDTDSTWAGPYVAWAERAGVIRDPQEADQPLRRGEWRRMLMAVIPSPPGLPPPENATAFLQAPGVLRPDCPIDPLETVSWSEIASDLEQVRALGVRVPRFAADTTRHREECRRQLAIVDPARSLDRLARRRDAPNGAEACLLIADLTWD